MRLKCFRCGHQWESRVEKPSACPACKSYRYSYDVVKKGYIDQTKENEGRGLTWETSETQNGKRNI